MAMINIEYRHSKPVRRSDTMRRSTEGMERYLDDIVKEMRSAGISVALVDSTAIGDEGSSLFINDRNVKDILGGLKILFPEEDDHCDDLSAPKIVSFQRPLTDWNNKYAEDIPDILLKNAISKTYSELRKDNI